MLRIGGAERASVLLIPPLRVLPPWPTTIEVPYTTDGLSPTTNSGRDSVNNITELSATNPDTFLQPTVGSSPESSQILPPALPDEPVDTYIVGPVVYMYFSTANSSGARFTVDILFRDQSYAKVSHHSTFKNLSLHI